MAPLRPLKSSAPAPVACARDGWVVAAGEIDTVTAPDLATALAKGACDGVDLGAVTFIDVAGLRVILEAGRQAQATGRRLTVARASPQIRRLLAITAIDRTVDVLDDQSSAITSLYPMSSSSRESSPP